MINKNDKSQWKGVFTLFYKTQHRIVKSLSKIRPRTTDLTKEEQWNLINLIEANEYLYDMRLELRGLENLYYSTRDRLIYEREMHSKTKRELKYWKERANHIEYPPTGFLDEYQVC